MLPIIALVLTAQLTAVQVDIGVQAGTAVVQVRYQLQRSDTPPAFTLIRLPGQRVWLADQRLVLEEREGLTRITAPPSAQGTLEYTVQGALDRIPIPVPEGALAAEAGGVTITVTGLDPGARFARGFPRLVAGEQGMASAHLANVPSLIRLPPTGSGWSVSTIAQVGVLLLLVTGSVVLWRRRARSHTA